MERLPYIDQHSRLIAADRAQTWAALLRTACKNPDDHASSSIQQDWSRASEWLVLPQGFVLEEADPPKRLAANGEHWFSRYGIVFTLEEVDAAHTRLVIDSYGAFPGIHGRIYRALVVGTGGHRLVVRTMLRRMAIEAEKIAATERRS